ncbi:MAG: nucleotidyltransferase family protein [Endomicrobiia bacterium]
MKDKTIKALILAAGRGKRLGKIVEGQNKCMLKVFGRPLIEYSLDCAKELEEVSEIIIVVGYRAEDIINWYGNNYKGKRIKYVIQWEQRGVVDAIEVSAESLEGKDFMLMLGDEFMFNPRHNLMVKNFFEYDLFGICGVIRVKDTNLISKTYTIDVDNDFNIKQLIEKPDKPFNDLMGTGNCIFKYDILSYIPSTPINKNRGEKELPDLIQEAINNNCIIKYFPICDKYVNINSPKELKEIESYFSHG